MTQIVKRLVRPSAPASGPVTDRQRGILTAIKAKYPQTSGYIVTPGFIRVEQAISNGKPRYNFSVTKDSNSDSVTEVKLDRNDKFLVDRVGLFLMKRLSTLTGIEVLQTYPNSVAIPDDAANFLAAHLEAFYNGSMSVQVGQTLYIEKMDTRRFRYVGNSMESATIIKSEAGEEAGFIKLTPQFELDGDGKTMISIEAPIHANAKVANTVANTTNYLVLMFRGFLITKR